MKSDLTGISYNVITRSLDRVQKGKVRKRGKLGVQQKATRVLSRGLRQGEQVETSKSNVSSKVDSTEVRDYILQSQVLRTTGKQVIGVKAKGVNKKSRENQIKAKWRTAESESGT